MGGEAMIKPDTPFPAEALRAEFPALSQEVNGRRVAFLDSAASAQKPRAVIESMDRVMQTHYANVHRGVYSFSQKTTQAFEDARRKVAGFLGTDNDSEIVFTRNATEAINLVAAGWGRKHLKAGDEIILTTLEHHANIVPWHMLREELGVVLKVVPLLDGGALDMKAYKELLGPKTRLVAVGHMSNALGTINPVAEITRLAKQAGDVKVLVDGSQAVVHLPVDVSEIGCDFYVFTGHKLYGPSGIGALWGRYDVLDTMQPYQGGGEMIEQVGFDEITYKEPPHRFEAGTPAIVEVIGLGAAIDFVQAIGREDIAAYEAQLLRDAEAMIKDIPGLTLYSRAPERAGILSFTVDGAHPHDVATILDQMGVAVRAGHHCAQPLMKALGVPATTRASLALYNTGEDVARLAEALEKVKSIFG